MTAAMRVIALTLLLPAFALAQELDPTASTLAVKRGEKVIVTVGTTHETLSGRLLRFADDGLVLADGPTPRTVRFSDVQRIERRRDSLWNGALIGYAVGFGAGAGLVLAQSCHPQPRGLFELCFNGPAFAAAFGGVITGPIGMAAGAIADAIVKRPRVVFDRRSGHRATITATPTLLSGGGGVRVAITFP
jgi:hypothetical protein